MGKQKTQTGRAKGKQEGEGAEPADDAGATTPQGKKAAPEFVMHQHIGGRLKEMFQEVVGEPVPDKFRELLEELERKQPKR